MERSARARMRSGTHTTPHRFHVIPGSVHDHKREKLMQKKKGKEMTVKYVIISVSIAAALAMGFLAVNFGS